MLTNDDLEFFAKHHISVAPPSPKQKLGDVKELTNNPFLYFESYKRFLGIEFIKFPDEQRCLTHQDKTYLCFGKSDYDRCYFAIGEIDKVIYQLCSDDDDKFFVFPINENINNFASSFNYFLSTIYGLIADRGLIGVNGDDDYLQKITPLFKAIAENFKQKIQSFDNYAFADNEIHTYWNVLYHMLIEADLTFYLPSVSLMDYMKTGRFGNDNS